MSCKPTYKGVRYNSLEELYNAHGVNAQQKQQTQGFENKPSTIASTIFELEPDITEEKLRTIYDNYVALMNRQREGKAIPYDVFGSLLNSYQVYKHKDTYIFGNYDANTATFVTRINSSPSSKQLLAEAIPNLVEKGIDFISFVPKDYADKLVRSGYTTSVSSFNYDFKGEEMDKFAVASNPNVFNKIFNKSHDDVTSEEIEDYNHSQNLRYTPVEIDEELIEKAGEDASKIFETYLSQFGIVVKDINEIKDKLGIDELGFADILSKIAYVKDKKDLPPIAGEFIAHMMQYNPLVKDIIMELSQTPNYKKLKKDEYFKIIGGLIADDLQNKLEGNYSKSLLDKLKQLIKDFFSLLNNTPVDLINTNIGIISNNIIQQNKKLITASLYKPGAFGQPTQQVNIEDALEKDKFGASIIGELSKKGFILTGSTALSEQGVILRPNENPLHDIDWVSPFVREETIEKFLNSYPDAIKVRDIYGNGYITDSYLIAPEGYSISNYRANNYNGKIIIDSYDVIDSKGDVVGTYRLQKQENSEQEDGKKQKDSKQSEEVVTGVEGKVIDFFSYENYASKNPNKPFNYKSKDGVAIQLANWKDVFKAKLDFARYKDIWDYNRFMPNDNVQTPEQQKQQAQEMYAQYLAQNPNGDVEGFKNWVNESNNRNELQEDLNERLDNIAGIEFIYNDAELPQAVRQNPHYSPDNWNAVWHNGKVYFNGNRVKTQKQAVALWVHEVGVHSGIRKLIPEDQLDTFFEQVYTSFENSKDPQMQEIFKLVKDEYAIVKNGKLTNTSEIGDELLAHFGEYFVGAEQISPAQQSIWNEILDRIKTLIEKVIGSETVLNRKQIEDIVLASVQAVKQDPNEIFSGDTLRGNRFSKSEIKEHYPQFQSKQHEVQKDARKQYNRDDIRFSLSNRARRDYENRLSKNRPDLSGVDRASFFDFLDTIDDKKTEVVTFHWFNKGKIIVPEDMPKVKQAIKIANRKKIDPLSYDSPMDLIEANSDVVIKAKPIDPDTVSTLTNKVEYEHGITVYDVDESEQSRKNMREIINTHYGKDRSPWCLLQGNGKGNLTDESKRFWNSYNATKKKVAFKNGKLLAFYASRRPDGQWWDRNDRYSEGIPITQRIPNDRLKRVGTYEYDTQAREMSAPFNVHRGNRKNGVYEEWHDNGQKSEESHWKDGELQRLETWYNNGQINSKRNQKNGKPHGLQETWYSNGQISTRHNYKDGKIHGLIESWDFKGQYILKYTAKDNGIHGLYERWYGNGQLRERSNWKDDKGYGLHEIWEDNGQIIQRSNWKDSEKHGTFETWDSDGKQTEKSYWKDGKKVRGGKYKALFKSWVDNFRNISQKISQSEFIPLFPAQPSKIITDNSQNQKEITQEQIDTEIAVAEDSEVREVGILEEELGTEAAIIVSTNPETREGGEYYSIDIGDENEMNTSIDENADFSEYLNSRIELLNAVENKIKKLHRNKNRSEKENTLLEYLTDMQEALQEEISDNVDNNKKQVIKSLYNEIDALVSLIDELNSTNDPTEVMLKLEANQFFDRLEFVSQLLDDRDSDDKTYFHEQLLKGFSDGESIYNKLFTEVNKANKKFENSVVNYMINLVLSEDTWIDIKKSAIANATNDKEAEKKIQDIEDKIKEIIEDPENIYIDNDSKLSAGFVVPSNMYNSLMADFIYVTRNNIEKTEKQKLSSARNIINTVFKKIEDIRLPNGETLQEALFEKDRFGGRSQKLIRPLSSFWYSNTFPKIRGAIKDFQTSLYLRDGDTEEVYKDMIKSIQANGDILILQKIPSIAKKYKDVPELSEFFTYTYSEMADYENHMIEHYGETAYRKILAESERSLSNFVNDPETIDAFRYDMNPLAFIKHFYSENSTEANKSTGSFNNPKYNYIMPKYGDKRFINEEFAAIEQQGIEGFNESYSALEESLEYISNTFPDETNHTTVPNLIHNTTRETLNHWRYTRNWNPNLLRFLNIITDRFSKYLDGFSGTFIRNEYETKNKKGQELVAKNFSSYGRRSIKSSMEVLQHAPFEVLNKKAKELGLSIPADYSDSAKDRKELIESIATASITKTSELNMRVRMNAALEIAESYNTRLETNKVIEFVKTFLRKKGAKHTYDYISGQQEVNVHKNGFRSISSMIKPNFSDKDVALSKLDPSDPDYKLPSKKKVKRLSPAEKEVKKLLEEEKENLYGWNVSFTFQGVEYYVDKKTKKPYKKTYEGENLDEEVNVPMLPEEFENVYKKYFEARMSQLGKGVTTSSILQGLGANVSAVYLRLNFLAGYGNRLQGKFQNNMGAASGLNGYDTYSLFLARKFLNFKNTDKMFRLYANAPGFLFTKKKRQQMEILNMIIDNFHLVEQQFDLDVGKDQFLSAISQKYANFASDLSVNNPEDQNQSELLLAMFIKLKIEKIVGQNADGTNRTEMVPFFDPDTFTFPYETDGSLTLKPEFQTQTNIENWQSGGKGGEQSSFFMNRYKNNRDRLHGAYAENQKSNIRNNIFGELAMKFKPWMVANLFNEYGYKTIDYSTGTLDKKGRSLPFLEHPTVGITHLLASNLAGNGTLTGSAILAIAPILGLSGAMSVAIPAVLGVTILGTGYFGYQHLKKRKNILDSQKTNMKAEIRLTASYALETFQRILQTTARHIPLHKYDTTKGLLNTEKAINFALTKNAGISEADRRLMSEKSQLVADKLLLGVTTLIGSRLIAAMLKSLLIDDDDDDEEKEHQEKEITQYLNAFFNVMNGAMTNQNMWEDPIAIFSSAASLPVEKFVYGSVSRVTKQAGKALDGKSTWEDVGWKAARSASEYAGVPSTLRKIADGTLLQNPRSYNRGWYGEEETKRSYKTEDRNLTKELDDNRGRFRVNAKRIANKKLLEMFPDLGEYKREELASKVMQRFLQEQGAYNPKDPKKAIEEVNWDSLVEEFKDYELPLTEEGELKSRRKKKKKKRRKKKSGGNSLGTSL